MSFVSVNSSKILFVDQVIAVGVAACVPIGLKWTGDLRLLIYLRLRKEKRRVWKNRESTDQVT